MATDTGIIFKPGYFLNFTSPVEDDVTVEMLKYEALRTLEDELIEKDWQLIRNDGIANLWAEEPETFERMRFHVSTVLQANNEVNIRVDILEAK